MNQKVEEEHKDEENLEPNLKRNRRTAIYTGKYRTRKMKHKATGKQQIGSTTEDCRAL